MFKNKKQPENSIYPEKKPKKHREKINPIPWIIVLGVIAVIVAVCLFVAYALPYLQINSFKKTDDGLYDKKNDITYVYAPSYYESVLVVTDPQYARVDDIGVYRIGYRDDDDVVRLSKSTEWLGLDSDHGSAVLYNPDLVDLPDPAEFDFSTVYICTATTLTFATQQLDDKASADVMTAFFENVKTKNLYGSDIHYSAELIKQLRVTSNTYTSLHLVLYLYQLGDDYYICLPELDMFAETDSDVFDVYFAASDGSVSGDS